jgi:lipopolysaccharide transport system permease protein
MTSTSSYDTVRKRAGLIEARRKTVINPPSLSAFDLPNRIATLIRYRDLLYTLGLHRIKVRYKQSLLGVSWAVLQPVSLMLIFTFIFSLITRMPSDGTPYAVFAYTALLPWTYFANALSSASNSLVSHSHLVTKVYFPREILPLTYVMAALFDFLIASSALAGLLIYYGIGLTVNALYAIPIMMVLTMFVTAMAFLFSALQVRFRDVGFAIPLLLQLWMFATPIIYPLSAVPERIRSFYMLNPMVGVVQNFRLAVLHGASPDLRILGVSALISVALLAVSYIYFKRVEATMADII